MNLGWLRGAYLSVKPRRVQGLSNQTLSYPALSYLVMGKNGLSPARSDC